MIPKEAVLSRLDAYLSREHPELYGWAHQMPFIVRDIRTYPFLTLAEALELPSPVYLEHNGFARLGMPFEDLVAYFGAHPNPIEIPIRIEIHELLRGEHKCWHRRTLDTKFEGSEYSFFEDTDYRISIDNLHLRFLEGLFGLSYATFRSAIVEPGGGLRLDRNGQMGGFADKLLVEGVPLFLDFVRTGESEEDKAYVVNGFEI